MNPSPPSIVRTVRIALYKLLQGLGLGIAIAFFFFFPGFVYLMLYHADLLIIYSKEYSWSFVGSTVQYLDTPQTSATLGAICVWMLFDTISTHRRQLKEWSEAQEQMAHGKDPFPLHPMKLPAPAQPPLAQAEFVDRRVSRNFFLVEGSIAFFSLVIYWIWLGNFFRWPPNPVFDHIVLGMALGFFVVMSVIALRVLPTRIAADQTGIVFRGRLIPWSQVRQLVLIPVLHETKSPAPIERYSIVTTTRKIVFAAIPIWFQTADQQETARTFVAFIMQQANLLLLVDRLELQSRNRLVAIKSTNSQKIRQGATSLACIGLVVGVLILGFIIPIEHAWDVVPHDHFHSISGQVVEYSYGVGNNGRSYGIRLAGDPTKYWLPDSDIWPIPPNQVSNGTSVTMLVAGTDVGVFDVHSGNVQGRYTTQAYAERWINWIQFIIITVILGIPGCLILVFSLRHFWRQWRGIAPSPPLTLFPPPDYTAPPE
jgi:hypothetical protein